MLRASIWTPSICHLESSVVKTIWRVAAINKLIWLPLHNSILNFFLYFLADSCCAHTCVKCVPTESECDLSDTDSQRDSNKKKKNVFKVVWFACRDIDLFGKHSKFDHKQNGDSEMSWSTMAIRVWSLHLLVICHRRLKAADEWLLLWFRYCVALNCFTTHTADGCIRSLKTLTGFSSIRTRSGHRWMVWMSRTTKMR